MSLPLITTWCLIKRYYVFMAWCLVKHRDNFTSTFTDNHLNKYILMNIV